MTALPTFATEANTLAADVSAKQLLAATSQTNSATSETNAAASAAAAAASSGATLWVSGTTYAVGDTRFSPIDFRTYRSKTVHGGSTDPSADFTNWQIQSAGPFPYLHVRDEKASGTNGGNNSAGANDRTLNTTVGTNTIAGSSLSSSQVTLPAGTYEIYATAPGGSGCGLHKLRLYNVTDSVVTLVGTSENSTQSPMSSNSIVAGKFTIAATKVFKLSHYTVTGSAGVAALGYGVGSGDVEVFASMQLWKVA